MRKRTAILILLLAGGGFVSGQLRSGQMGQPGTSLPPGVQRPGTQPAGTEDSQWPGQEQQPKVDDATLQRQIHEQLATHSELAKVTASVKNGVVYLQGSVPRNEDRKEVRKLVNSIPGVQGLKEKLAINPETGPTTSTTSMNSIQGSGQSGGTGGVATNNGAGQPERNTTATGAVSAPSRTAKQSAESISMHSDSSLAGQIENALRADPSLAQDDITVGADEDQIVLTGTVATGKEKQTAERIAESYASNRKVIDRISVSSRR